MSAKKIPHEHFFYVGAYTNGKSKGIYLYKMGTESGKLEMISGTENIINPSFLAIDKTHNCLYTVNEISNYEGTNSGSISTFSIELHGY